jgi:hypothetical protein
LSCFVGGAANKQGKKGKTEKPAKKKAKKTQGRVTRTKYFLLFYHHLFCSIPTVKNEL